MRLTDRKNIFLMKCCAIFLALFLLLAFFACQLADAPAKASAPAQCSVVYKTVPVTSGDTLWSIATQNYSSDCGSIQEYIEEIMQCNSLHSQYIHAGSYLLIPVYTPEQNL